MLCELSNDSWRLQFLGGRKGELSWVPQEKHMEEFKKNSTGEELRYKSLSKKPAGETTRSLIGLLSYRLMEGVYESQNKTMLFFLISLDIISICDNTMLCVTKKRDLQGFLTN